MDDDRRRVVAWEAASFVFTVAVGGALHFAFEWSGYWRPLAIFAAVNESTWEHLKLAFWPALLFALIESLPVAPRARNYWPAKTVGLLTAPLTIVVLFYGYTAVLGDNSLPFDIGTFVVGVALGHVASVQVMKRRPLASSSRWLLAGVLTVVVAAFSVLTIYPPRAFLFEDPRNGQYGILEEYAGHDH